MTSLVTTLIKATSISPWKLQPPNRPSASSPCPTISSSHSCWKEPFRNNSQGIIPLLKPFSHFPSLMNMNHRPLTIWPCILSSSPSTTGPRLPAILLTPHHHILVCYPCCSLGLECCFPPPQMFVPSSSFTLPLKWLLLRDTIHTPTPTKWWLASCSSSMENMANAQNTAVGPIKHLLILLCMFRELYLAGNIKFIRHSSFLWGHHSLWQERERQL